ncbi:hypothetical protein ACFC06_27665 [Nocardia sp. NPDC056064]
MRLATDIHATPVLRPPDVTEHRPDSGSLGPVVMAASPTSV